MAKNPDSRLILQADLVETAEGCVFAVVFLQSTGKGSRLAVAAAKGASVFFEFEAEARLKGYFAGFSDSRKDIDRLRVLAPLVSLWRGTVFFIRGRPTRWCHLIEQTLDCLSRSHTHECSSDYCRAVKRLRYAPVVIPFASFGGSALPPPAPEPVPAVVMPCRRLSIETIKREREITSLRSATISAAIDAETIWCPRFDISTLDEITVDE